MPDEPLVGGGAPSSTCAPSDAYYLLNAADSRLPNATTLLGTVIAGPSAPSDSRYLWRDTSVSPAVLRYFDGALWAAFAQAGPAGAPGPPPWSALTADFDAGAVGAGGLTIAVGDSGGFAAGSYLIVTDITGAQAFYRLTSAASGVLTVSRLSWDRSAAPGYAFTVANAAVVSVTGFSQTPPVSGQAELITNGDLVSPDLVYTLGDVVTI